MTQEEYEKRLRAQGLDPDCPIQQGKRYRVTGWDRHNPLQVMTVWTDTVTETMVKGHITRKGYPLTDTCVWTRHLANSWVWTEIERGN